MNKSLIATFFLCIGFTVSAINDELQKLHELKKREATLDTEIELLSAKLYQLKITKYQIGGKIKTLENDMYGKNTEKVKREISTSEKNRARDEVGSAFGKENRSSSSEK